MKYLLLIQHFDPDVWEHFTEDEKAAIYAEYKAIAETPGVSPGLLLQPAATATTVRIQDGKTLTTDGPFVAVKEALGGYLFFEAADLDAAIELAARIPQARRGGAVELRPIMEGKRSSTRSSDTSRAASSSLPRRTAGSEAAA
jgi:hypothetical protein